MWSHTTNFKPRAVALACAALLAGCGGGGGSSDGGMFQAIDFNYPGGLTVGAPGTVVTTTLKATATSGAPVTFSSNSATGFLSSSFATGVHARSPRPQITGIRATSVEPHADTLLKGD